MLRKQTTKDEVQINNSIKLEGFRVREDVHRMKRANSLNENGSDSRELSSTHY